MRKKENPKALKLLINKNTLLKIASSIKTSHPAFSADKFSAHYKELDPLELKDRVRFIRDLLKKYLPDDYLTSVSILVNSLKNEKLNGFDLWAYTDFVQTFGLKYPKQSMLALAEMTKQFTSEFAIRPFINQHTDAAIAYLEKCSLDKNVHLRRWASEGSRSRLPWGERLDLIINDPTLTEKILDNLKFDDELYVRKSVANHLNDLAKDHPDYVIKILNRWKSLAKNDADQKKINWIIYRSLRTLIKQGHPNALKLIGVENSIDIKLTKLNLNKNIFKTGDRLEFYFDIKSNSTKTQKIVIDYIIHFVKANKKTAAKVFKLKNLNLAKNETLKIQKAHHLKKVSTRTYYPGEHALEIQINGKTYQKIKWFLT